MTIPNRTRFCFLVSSFAWFVCAALHGQAVPPFDPSQTRAVTQPALDEELLKSQDLASSGGLEVENTFAPTTPGDNDLGQQLILKRNDKIQPFKVWADGGAFWTDNAANANEGELDDWFFSGGVNAAWQQRVAGRFYADVFLAQHWYSYDEYSELDYEAGDAAVGTLILMPELFNSILHAHYYYQRITQNIEDSPIYETHNVRVGMQKTFLIDRLNSINTGILASFGCETEPDLLQRHEYAALFGYNFKITRSLVLSLSYRIAYYDYFNLDGREDWYHNTGANVVWRPKEFCELSVGYNFVSNQSSEDYFSYDAQTTGPSLALTIKF